MWDRTLRPGPTRGRVICLKPGHGCGGIGAWPVMAGSVGSPVVVGFPWLPFWALALGLGLPLPVTPVLVLSLPLFGCPSLTVSPCVRANELTHWPMPCTPNRTALALQASTTVVTCWPQLVGLTLPVIATSVAATAMVVAAAATAIPVRILMPIAAPAPPKSRFMLPPDCIALRNGIGPAVIGSRIRCSSCFISSSKSFMSDMSGRRNALLGRINHFSFPHVDQRDLQLLARSGQPGGNSLFGHAERSRDLAVGVAVVVAHHQRRRLLGRELAELPDQI